ncbi:flagellar hook-basal body complex protein [Thalassospiraceae bacterium LMO-SO8]|nr:flagellar hook-basal body complex protein [Alphaproteobacteria bacterium LMO-S08]WND74994.1 flagellar hook-basal body complex protein [Thalassospiraceae bacterium LMO-SO8]
MSLGIFQQATSAMMGQSHKLNTISQNVANLNTDGYKRTDTEFRTLMNKGFTSIGATTAEGASGTTHSDLGGTAPVDFQRISNQGQVRTTDRNLDVAIIGSGFFMVSPDINVNGNIQYTRRGAFDINVTDLTDSVTLSDGTAATVNQGYLADQFGNFLLGYAVNSDGSFTLGTPAPMRVDQFAFEDTGEVTTTASVDVNLPADAASGTTFNGSIKVVDSSFDAQSIRVDFTKAFDATNLWDFRLIGDNIASVTTSPGGVHTPVSTTLGDHAVRFSTVAGGGGVITAFTNNNPGGGAQLGSQLAGTFAGLKPGDTITVAGSGGNDQTYTIASISENQAEITLDGAVPLNTDEVTTNAITFSSTASIPQRLEFGNTGALTSDSEYTFDVTFDNGETASFTFDASTFTQFAGDFSFANYEHNGAESAAVSSLSFGPGGEIYGEFTDNTRRVLYKVPLAIFPNPNGLEISTGQNFQETEASGEPNQVFADESGFATLLGNALEGSNVDLGTEMSRLIAAQAAYNVAATSFKTADEMLQEAANLKR